MTTATPLLPPAEWRDFLALTKPRVMTLVVFTGLCGMLAAPVGIHPVIGFTAILVRRGRSTNGMNPISTR
jgi:protoheme IX farnesyltransferase